MRKPNVKGNRVRKSSGAIFKDYSEQHSLRFSNDVIRKVIKTYNKNMIAECLENRDGVEVPGRLGLLILIGIKGVKRRAIDFKKSLDLGVKVYHENFETDGHLGKIFLFKNKAQMSFPNRMFWVFSPIREFKRSCAKVYRENWKKFSVVESKNKISRNEMLMKKKEVKLDNYNDLEL